MPFKPFFIMRISVNGIGFFGEIIFEEYLYVHVFRKKQKNTKNKRCSIVIDFF